MTDRHVERAREFMLGRCKCVYGDGQCVSALASDYAAFEAETLERAAEKCDGFARERAATASRVREQGRIDMGEIVDAKQYEAVRCARAIRALKETP
jgi:hypothetical protein